MDPALMNDDQRREHFHRLARDYSRRYANLVVDALGGQVSADTDAVVYRIGFDLGHDACQILARAITSRVTPAADDRRPTVIITREQLECWAGRELSDDEVASLDDCIPHSSIPQAIGDIVASFPEGGDGDE